MVQRQSGGPGLETRERAEGHLRAVGGLYVNVFQRIGVLLELRIHFDDHVILIQLSEDGGDQALAESVVESVVDIGGKNAKARSGVAVDGECGDKALVQLVAGDIAKVGQCFQFLNEAACPVSEFLRINIFQAVLKLGAAHTVFDGQILNGLEEERNSVDFRKFGLEAADHIRGADIALGERLQIDLDAAAVERGVRAVDADERRKALDRWVFEDDAGQIPLALGHGRERNVLCALGNAQNDARVLHREKSFGNVNIEKNGAHKSGNGNEEGDGAKTQDKLQGASVESDDGVKSIFGLAIEPALLLLFVLSKELGAHHGSECEGYKGGNEDGDGQSDGKFTEEPADDITHKEKRNEHGNERDSKRNDGKADLFGTLQRGLQRRFALFDVAADILDHDDGVVDDEAGGNGEGHERKIVQAVAEKIHDREGSDQRKRNGNAGNDGGAEAAEKKKNDHHDERHGEHQGELHVADGGANGGGAIREYLHLDRSGERGFKLGQKVFHAVDNGDDVRAGLSLNIQNNGGIQIGAGGLLGVLHPVDNVGDVSEAHRRAIVIDDDERSIAVAGDELVVRADGVSLMQAVESALGLIDIGLAEGGTQILKTEPVRSESRGIRRNANGGALAAADADESDAGKLRNFLGESRVGEVLDFGERERC